MSEHETFNFDESIELVEIPVIWEGETYLLKEANGHAAAQYQNALLSSASMASDGSVSKITGMADAEPLLVHLCMWKGARNVPLITVKSWPSRMVEKLFEKAKEISEIDREESMKALLKRREKLDKLIAEKKAKADPAKNEQGDTTDGYESPENLDTVGR